MINSAKRCDICYRISVQEDHYEVSWVKDLVTFRLKKPFLVGSFVLMLALNGFLFHVERCNLFNLLGICSLVVVRLHHRVIILKVLSSSELVHHNHLVFSHLGGHVEQFVFLLLLSQIYDICPALLVLGFEVFEELVKAFVSFTHISNRLVQTLSFFSLVRLYEGLKLFDFLKGSGSSNVAARSLLLLFVLEEEHLAFLVLVQVRVVQHHVWSSVFAGKASI
jgi:hypothetical protein